MKPKIVLTLIAAILIAIGIFIVGACAGIVLWVSIPKEAGKALDAAVPEREIGPPERVSGSVFQVVGDGVLFNAFSGHLASQGRIFIEGLGAQVIDRDMLSVDICPAGTYSYTTVDGGSAKVLRFVVANPSHLKIKRLQEK